VAGAEETGRLDRCQACEQVEADAARGENGKAAIDGRPEAVGHCESARSGRGPSTVETLPVATS
jgi:hypothetical protein